MTELEDLRRRYPPTEVVTFSFLGVAISVHTNDAGVASGLTRYFSPFRQEVAPRDALPVYVLQGTPTYDAARLQDVARSKGRSAKEAFYDAPGGRVVVKRRTGVVVYVAEPEHGVVGDVLRNLNQAANAVSTVFAKAMLRRGYIMLHASATLGEEGGVAFAAQSGAGKSTMALALLEEGHRFVTNDRLLVRLQDRHVEMVGVPRIPRVNPGTLLRLSRLTALLPPEARRRYERMPPAALWAIEEKRDVEVDRIFGPGTFQLTGRLRIVYILAWHQGGTGWDVRALDRASRLAALQHIAKDLGVHDLQPLPPAAQRAQLDAIAEAIPVYEISGQPDVGSLTALIVGPHRSPVR